MRKRLHPTTIFRNILTIEDLNLQPGAGLAIGGYLLSIQIDMFEYDQSIQASLQTIHRCGEHGILGPGDGGGNIEQNSRSSLLVHHRAIIVSNPHSLKGIYSFI